MEPLQEPDGDPPPLSSARISISHLIDNNRDDSITTMIKTPPNLESSSTSDEDSQLGPTTSEYHDIEPSQKRKVRQKKRYGQLVNIGINKSKPPKINSLNTTPDHPQTIYTSTYGNIQNNINPVNEDHSTMFSKFRMVKSHPLTPSPPPPPPQPPAPLQLQPIQGQYPPPQIQYQNGPPPPPHMGYNPMLSLPPQQPQIHMLPQMLVQTPLVISSQPLPSPQIIPNSPMMTVIPCLNCQNYNKMCNGRYPNCQSCEISNLNCQYPSFVSQTLPPIPPTVSQSSSMTLPSNSSGYFSTSNNRSISESYQSQISSDLDQSFSVVIDSINFELTPSTMEVITVKKSTLLTCGDSYFKLFSLDFPIVSKQEFLNYFHQFLYNGDRLNIHFKFELFMILAIGSKAIENLNGSTVFSISQQFVKQAILLNKQLNADIYQQTSNGKKIDNLRRLLLLGIYSLLESSEMISWEISGKLSRLISLLEPDYFKQEYQLKLLCSNIYLIEGIITATLSKTMTISESYLIDDNIEHSRQLRIRQLEILIMQSRKKRVNSIISYADKKSIESQLSYWLKGQAQDEGLNEWTKIQNKRSYYYLLISLYYYSSNTSSITSANHIITSTSSSTTTSITPNQTTTDNNRRKIIEHCQDFFQLTVELVKGGNFLVGWISLYRFLNICTIYMENLLECYGGGYPELTGTTVWQNFTNCQMVLSKFNPNNHWMIVNQVAVIIDTLINLHKSAKLDVNDPNYKSMLLESYNSYISVLKQNSSLDFKTPY